MPSQLLASLNQPPPPSPSEIPPQLSFSETKPLLACLPGLGTHLSEERLHLRLPLASRKVPWLQGQSCTRPKALMWWWCGPCQETTPMRTKPRRLQLPQVGRGKIQFRPLAFVGMKTVYTCSPCQNSIPVQPGKCRCGFKRFGSFVAVQK